MSAPRDTSTWSQVWSAAHASKHKHSVIQLLPCHHSLSTRTRCNNAGAEHASGDCTFQELDTDLVTQRQPWLRSNCKQMGLCGNRCVDNVSVLATSFILWSNPLSRFATILSFSHHRPYAGSTKCHDDLSKSAKPRDGSQLPSSYHPFRYQILKY